MNDQQKDITPSRPRLIGDAEIKQYAANDAAVDGTDSLFQAFRRRLTALAEIITKEDAAGTAQQFRD